MPKHHLLCWLETFTKFRKIAEFFPLLSIDGEEFQDDNSHLLNSRNQPVQVVPNKIIAWNTNRKNHVTTASHPGICVKILVVVVANGLAPGTPRFRRKNMGKMW